MSNSEHSVGECLIRHVAQKLDNAENIWMMLNMRCVCKSWLMFVTQAATNLLPEYAAGITPDSPRTLFTWEADDGEGEHSAGLEIILSATSPSSKEVIAQSLADYILSVEGGQWDREDILNNLDEDDDDELAEILAYSEDEMVAHICRFGALDYTYGEIGPSVSFTRSECKSMKDIDNFLQKLFYSIHTGDSNSACSMRRCIAAFKFILCSHGLGKPWREQAGKVGVGGKRRRASVDQGYPPDGVSSSPGALGDPGIPRARDAQATAQFEPQFAPQALVISMHRARGLRPLSRLLQPCSLRFDPQ